ncbi:MAG TPA: hypothetical protein VKU01_03085 [Bryobacteraceae bacterium]|nr:hypothetical protein [Bryobacteraceae bacterium]
MRSLRFAAIFVAATALAAGQSGSNSLTVTASRQIYSSPSSNQLQIAINLTSPLTAGLDDVVSALPGVGVNATNLTGVTGTSVVPTNPASSAYLQWTFTLQVELAKAMDLISTLTTLQQTFSQANNGWTLSFTVGTAITPASGCPLTDLVSDAESRAKDVAAAGGFTLGKILALSNALPGTAGLYVPGVSSRVTAVLSATNYIASSVACSVAVKFELLQ